MSTFVGGTYFKFVFRGPQFAKVLDSFLLKLEPFEAEDIRPHDHPQDSLGRSAL